MNLHKWDPDALISSYHDRLASENASVTQQHEAEQIAKNICSVCEYRVTNLIKVSCGHAFCKPCWTILLGATILHDKNGDEIKCLNKECEAVLQDDEIIENIEYPNMLNAYKALAIESFIKHNPLLQCCPAESCSLVEADHYEEVECKCGKLYCFKCCGEPQNDSIREMFEKWKDLFINKDDVLSKELIEMNKTEPFLNSHEFYKYDEFFLTVDSIIKDQQKRAISCSIYVCFIRELVRHSKLFQKCCIIFCFLNHNELFHFAFNDRGLELYRCILEYNQSINEFFNSPDFKLTASVIKAPILEEASKNSAAAADYMTLYLKNHDL